MTPSVVAAADGLVFRSDGAVFQRCLPGGSRGEWIERQPIPGTDRALAVERERSGAPGLPRLSTLKEAS